MPPSDRLTAWDRLRAARADLRRSAALARKWAKVVYPVGRRVRFAHPIFRCRGTGVVRGHRVSATGCLEVTLTADPYPNGRSGGDEVVGIDRILELLPEDPPWACRACGCRPPRGRG